MNDRPQDASRTLARPDSQGLQHMDTGAWAEALKQLDEIQRIAPRYRETEGLAARVGGRSGNGQRGRQRGVCSLKNKH